MPSPQQTLAPPYLVPSALPAGAAEMWNFLRPFMTKTDPNRIPPSGYLSYLLDLPKIREVQWNDRRILRNPFFDSHPRDLSSLVMQVTGEYAPTPCTRCQQGKGPYVGCVLMSRAAPLVPQLRVISCANCYYKNSQTYCSHQEYLKGRFREVFPGVDGRLPRTTLWSPSGGGIRGGPAQLRQAQVVSSRNARCPRRKTHRIIHSSRSLDPGPASFRSVGGLRGLWSWSRRQKRQKRRQLRVQTRLQESPTDKLRLR